MAIWSRYEEYEEPKKTSSKSGIRTKVFIFRYVSFDGNTMKRVQEKINEYQEKYHVVNVDVKPIVPGGVQSEGGDIFGGSDLDGYILIITYKE